MLGEDFKQIYDNIHDKTFPNENQRKEIKQKAYSDRFVEYMELLKQKNFNEEIATKAVQKTDLKLRDGAKEFLRKMKDNNVPVIIISCSIGNVLTEYLKFNDCYYDNIYVYANCFDFKGKHICNVTPYNKNEISFTQEIEDKIKNRKYILLLGDLIDDKNMVVQDKLDDTITVGFLDKKIEENLEEYKKQFDVVLTNNSSFSELNQILN